MYVLKMENKTDTLHMFLCIIQQHVHTFFIYYEYLFLQCNNLVDSWEWMVNDLSSRPVRVPEVTSFDSAVAAPRPPFESQVSLRTFGSQLEQIVWRLYRIFPYDHTTISYYKA